MNAARGWTLNASFFLTVNAGLADEVTLAAVPGPAVLEWVSLAYSQILTVARFYALPGRVDFRENVPIGERATGEVLWSVATDEPSVAAKEGLVSIDLVPRLYPVGRMVRWWPWWLVVRAENIGGAAAFLYGAAMVRVLEDTEEVRIRPAPERMRVGEPRRHLWGRNPSGGGVAGGRPVGIAGY